MILLSFNTFVMLLSEKIENLKRHLHYKRNLDYKRILDYKRMQKSDSLSVACVTVSLTVNIGACTFK